MIDLIDSLTPEPSDLGVMPQVVGLERCIGRFNFVRNRFKLIWKTSPSNNQCVFDEIPSGDARARVNTLSKADGGEPAASSKTKSDLFEELRAPENMLGKVKDCYPCFA